MKTDFKNQIMVKLCEIEEILEQEEKQLKKEGKDTTNIQIAFNNLNEFGRNINSIIPTIGAYKLLIKFDDHNIIEIYKNNGVITLESHFNKEKYITNNEDFSDFEYVKIYIDVLIDFYKLDIKKAICTMYLVNTNDTIFCVNDFINKSLKDLDMNKMLDLIVSGEDYDL